MTLGPTAVLWDIDGTLLRAAGSGVRTFTAALFNVTGLAFPTATIDMGGRTDPDIAALILEAAGHDDHSVLPEFLAEVEAVWAAHEHEFREMTVVKAGVPEAIAALARHGAIQTIVTGNLESVARRKINLADLANSALRLELGGYGSDHALRPELVRLAVSRVRAAGYELAPERTWVVGDTHRDLAAARQAGVRCILVATGTQTFESLAELDADAVFADLTDVDAFCAALGLPPA